METSTITPAEFVAGEDEECEGDRIKVCPKCEEPVAHHSTTQVYCTLYRTYGVDEDGDIDFDQVISSEEGEDEPDGEGLRCGNCGHNYSQDDIEEIVDPDCCCEVCDPPEPADPDQLVRFVRPSKPPLLYQHEAWPLDMPAEVRALLSRRSLGYLPVRAERADELQEWLEWNREFHPHFSFQLIDPARTHLAFAIPETETT